MLGLVKFNFSLSINNHVKPFIQTLVDCLTVNESISTLSFNKKRRNKNIF